MKKTNIVLALVLVLVSLVAGARPAFADDPVHALRFDGVSDYVRLSATASMMAPGWESTKTLSLWVKPTGSAVCTAPNPSTCDAIAGDRPRSWGIARGAISGADRIWIWNYDGTFDMVGIEYTVDEWIQVALVHDGGVLSAYKNGVLVGSTQSGSTPLFGGLPVLQLGGVINNASRNYTFEGELDEVRLWNVARSAAELLQDMNVLLSGSEPGLAAYYQMSNGSGTALTDDSGNGWTGTLNDGGSGVPADGPITWVPSGAFGSSGGGNPNNIPPVADPQFITMAEDTAVSITLTGSDADEDPLSFRVVTSPANGALTGTAPDLTYTPSADFHGGDSFTFVANDGYVDSVPETVSITVTPTNDDPVAVDDTESTDIDIAVLIDVLDNDTDVDDDILTITQVGVVTPPLNGVAEETGGQVTYTPNPGFAGSDLFSYTISDGNGGSSTAWVSINVTLTGEGPGYALQFNGTSNLVRLAETSLMMAAGWESTKTVSLWVKPTGSSFCSAPSPTHCDAIFGDRPRWWGISRGMIQGLDRIWIWNYDGSLDAISIPYVVDEWIQIALVHGGGTLSAYKNGVLVGSVASGATAQPSTGAFPVLHVGGIINNANRNWTFDGEIDEVRIWETARSAAEINQNMGQPLAGTESGLIGYYQMSDGSGSFLTDDSGHGWTGTLIDGGTGVPPGGPILWVPSGAFGEP